MNLKQIGILSVLYMGVSIIAAQISNYQNVKYLEKLTANWH